MPLAIADLVLVCAAAVVCCVRPTRPAAWLLVVCSALWLPLNNGHLEGPVLITADPQHGLTAADLIGYGGWVIAAWTLRRAHRRRAMTDRGWLPVTTAALVLVSGIAVSYFVQPAPDDYRFHHHHWQGSVISHSPSAVVPPTGAHQP